MNDEDRCWICLGREDEEPPAGEKEHKWRRVCDCNIIAHEACLLEWAEEKRASENKVAGCPFCKTPFRIVTKRNSMWLKLRDVVEKLNYAGFQVMFFTTVGGSIFGTVYSTLYGLGATAIRCICPTNMALNLLGIIVSQGRIQFAPPTWRKALLIPMIPVWLVLCGDRSRAVDLTSLVLPLTLATREQMFPWQFTGARRTMLWLPVLRLAYHRFYDSLVDPLVLKCATIVRPSFEPYSGAVPGGNEVGPNINFQIDIQQINGNAAGNGNDNGNRVPAEGAENGDDGGMMLQQLEDEEDEEGVDEEAGLLNRIMLFGLDWAINWMDPPVPAAQLPENANNNNNNNNNNQLPPEELLHQNNDPQEQIEAAVQQQRRNRPRVGHTGDWVISPRSTTLKIGHALLWPLLGGIAGEALSQMATMRKLVPDRFNRNIVGALAVVALRDIANLGTAYLRTRVQTSRSVVDVSKRK